MKKSLYIKRYWFIINDQKKELKLFNLAKDIHEDTDVASTNSKVVKQLLAYAEAARKDLGDTNRPGKGQRKAGWVDEASPRLLKK